MPFDPTDKAKLLYDAVSKDYDLGTYDEFKSKLQDPTKRKAFFDGIGNEYDLGDYNTFNQKLGYDSQEVKEQFAPVKTFQDQSVKLSEGGTEPINTQNTPSREQFLNQPLQAPTENTPSRSQLLSQHKTPQQELSHFGVGNQPQVSESTKVIQPEQTLQQEQTKQRAEETQKGIDDAINKMAARNANAQYGEDYLKQNIKKQIQDGKLVPQKQSDGTFAFKQGADIGQSFVDALTRSHQQTLENNFLANADKNTKLEYLNRIRLHPETRIVQESNRIPTGIGGQLGNMIGENTELMEKGTIGALAGGLSEVTGGASMGTFGAMAQDFTNSGYAQGLMQNYNTLKEQNPKMSDEEALDKAEKVAPVNAAVNLATGAILSKASPEATEGLVNAFKQTIKSSPKVLGATALGSVAGDVAGMAAGEHKSADEILSHAGEATENMAVLHGLMAMPHIVGAALNEVLNIPANVKPQVENVVASMPREEVKNFYQEQEQKGTVPEGTADKVIEHLNNFDEQKKVVADLPIDEEQKAVVASRLTNKGEPEQISQPIELNPEVTNEQKNPTTAEPINPTTEEEPKEEPQAEVIQPKGVEGDKSGNEKAPEGIKSSWESNIEALVHPKTGLAAVTKKILEEQQPLKDAFLKRIGLSIDDYRKLNESEKQKVQDKWVNSKEFKDLSNEETKPIEPTQEPTENKVEPSKFPKPQIPLSEMNSEQLDNYANTVKDYSKNQEVEFFGKEGAKEYREAQSISNSSFASHDKRQEAYKIIDKYEKQLTPQQHNEFFGINAPEGVYDHAELRDIATRVRLVEESENVDELASSAKNALMQMNEKSPSIESKAILNAARKKADELNIKPEQLIKEVLKKVGNQYKDGSDAEFMMQTTLQKLLTKEEPAKMLSDATPEQKPEKQKDNSVVGDKDNPNISSASDFYHEYEKSNPQPKRNSGIRLNKYGKPIDENKGLYFKKQREWNKKANEAYIKHIDEQLSKGERLSDSQVESIASTYNEAGRLPDAEKLLTQYGYEKNINGKWQKPNADIESKVKSIESKAESDNEADLNEAIQKADELITQPINTETNTITDNEVKKPTDIGNKARDYAKKLRSGDANVLPDWLRANLPEGTKKSGISINDAFAKALEKFADIHDATKDFAKAVEEGFKHIKDWFDENKIPYNEQELKQKFADDRKAESVGDNETTSIKNATTQLRREQYGLNEEIPAAKKEFGETWDEAKKKIESGYDPQDLVDELAKNPRPVTDTENAILLHHQNTNEIKLENLNSKINEAAESGDEAAKAEYKAAKASVLDRLQKLYDVNKRVGTENARGLASRKMMVDRKYSLANMVAEKRASSNDGKPLSDEQQTEVEELHKKIKETQKAYDDYVAQAEGEIKDLQEKILGKKVANKKTAAQKLRDLADKIEKSKFGKADLGDGTQIQGVSIDINKFVADAVRLIADGLDKGGEVLDLIKDAVEKIKATNPDLDEKALNKAINKAVIDADIIKAPSKDDQLIKKYSGILSGSGADRKGLALRADAERAKNEFDITIKQDEQKSRSLLQKGQDIFVKWQRGFKLSNPLTLGKLTMAGMTRLVTTPLEDVVGGFYSAVLPQLAKGAIGEGGGLNVNETAKAYKNGLMQGIKDAVDIMRKGKHGKSNLDVVFGSPADLPPEAIDFFGQLHSAIKAPIKRFAFERGLERRLRRNIANGVDVSDPMVQTEILTGAYKDANRAIFMQDNKVATGYQKMVEYLSKADPKTGKAPSKPVATALQWMLPFVKVPTNIAAEIGAHVYGLEVGAGKIITNAFTKGLDNLSGDEKDIILRNLKKGSLGTAALVLGYMNPQIFGGYYQPKEKRSEEDAKAGSIKLFGMNIPAWFIEAPIYQTMQIGATIRRVKDTKVKDNGKVEEKGIGEGIWAGALGLADHVPMIDQPVRMASIFTDPKEREWYVGELAKSTVDPALLSYIANATDPADKQSSVLNPQNQRSPKTMAEHIKSGIPGLREQVPLKPSANFSDKDKQDPTFKYFIDKGMSLPSVSLDYEKIKDKKTHTEKSLRDYPQDVQEKYTDTHKQILKQELQKVKSKGYAYTDEYGKISTTYSSGEKRIPLSKLSTEQLAQVLHIAQSQATKKTKIKIFGTD